MEWEGNSSSVAGGSGESSCWGSYHDVPTPATQRGQTFMIMELCDRGSLAVTSNFSLLCRTITVLSSSLTNSAFGPVGHF